MNRRRFLKTVSGLGVGGLTGLALGSGCSDRGQKAVQEIPRKPYNVVLLYIDTLAANHMGCYGYERNTTPNIDRFAREHCVQMDCYAPETWTLPSTVSLVTGQFPIKHKVHQLDRKLASSEKTFPEVLQENGYQTYLDTEEFIPFVSPKYGVGQGFDEIHIARNRIDPNNNSNFINRFDSNRYDLLFNQMLRLREKRKPFFTLFHIGDVHAPYKALEPELNPFLNQKDSLYDPDPFTIGNDQDGRGGMQPRDLIPNLPLIIGEYIVLPKSWTVG